MNFIADVFKFVQIVWKLKLFFIYAFKYNFILKSWIIFIEVKSMYENVFHVITLENFSFKNCCIFKIP